MLAIVIPYYKITFFEETLQSLANQTDQRFTVYIGDDASTENPITLLEKFNGTFNFVYLRFDNNLGGTSLTQQWDRCIALTGSEEWIMILGDDDVLGANVVEEFYKNHPKFKSNSNVIRFSSQMIFEMTNNKSETFTNPVLEKGNKSYFRKFKGFSRSSLSEYFFSKEIYLKHGFKNYPLGWHSDDKAWLDFTENKLIYSINNAVVFIRISDSSISGKTDNKDLKYIAKINFLTDIIKQNFNLFNKNQRLELALEYESKVKWKRKLTLNEWWWMFKLYFVNFKLIPFLKLNRRFLIVILKIDSHKCFY
jgi:glycosyltransferase involved in cell wall biosynthesis